MIETDFYKSIASHSYEHLLPAHSILKTNTNTIRPTPVYHKRVSAGLASRTPYIKRNGK
ncbi:hypothetical protein Bhyg_09820, partial [Pseudolycoriella hygida]